MTPASRALRWLVIGLPFLWLGLFLLLPLLTVGKISISEPAVARPPYLPLWKEGAEGPEWAGTLSNYVLIVSDSLYLRAYLASAWTAAGATALTLLLGYPMAYFIARAPEPNRSLYLLLVILPFWTSFLLRVYAWIGLLRTNGPINQALVGLGLADAPLRLLQSDIAVTIGLVYTYLPFMVLPLYASLARMDMSILDAAGDLGARPWRAFLDVTLPLSLPGVLAGCLLVFVPMIGEFVVPTLLGGADTLMIGQVLWTEFFNNRDWPVAAAVAIGILVVVVLPLAWLQTLSQRRAL
jgi:putrescine transport system permease protein